SAWRREAVSDWARRVAPRPSMMMKKASALLMIALLPMGYCGLTDRLKLRRRLNDHKRNSTTAHVERAPESLSTGAGSFKRVLGRTARIRGPRDVTEIQRLDTYRPLFDVLAMTIRGS